MRKKIWISLGFILGGVVVPFFLSQFLNRYHSGYAHAYGLENILFFWMICGAVASVGANWFYCGLAKAQGRKGYQIYFTILEILTILLFLAVILLAYFAIGIRHMTIL